MTRTATGVFFLSKSDVTRARPQVTDVKTEILPSVLKLQKYEQTRLVDYMSTKNIAKNIFVVFSSLLDSQLVSNSIGLLSVVQTMEKCAADSERLESCKPTSCNISFSFILEMLFHFLLSLRIAKSFRHMKSSR